MFYQGWLYSTYRFLDTQGASLNHLKTTYHLKQYKQKALSFVLFYFWGKQILACSSLIYEVWNQAILQIKLQKFIHRKTLFILTFHSAFITFFATEELNWIISYKLFTTITHLKIKSKSHNRALRILQF